MKKQVTAVEWLIEQIMTSKYFYKLMEDMQSRSTVAQPNIFDQALEMEKEQIEDAYNKGYQENDRIGSEYYNENYK